MIDRPTLEHLGKTLISTLAVRRHKLTIQIEFLVLQGHVTTLENQESLVRFLLCRSESLVDCCVEATYVPGTPYLRMCTFVRTYFGIKT